MKRIHRLLFACLFACGLSHAAQAEPPFLDVGIVVFDAGIADPPPAAGKPVFPDIRRAEAVYLPVELRRVMENTGAWGAVRVMPSASDLVDLTLSARILESTGERLALQVTARDATGRAWLDSPYTATADEGIYRVPAVEDPFRALFTALSGDLLAQLRGLSAQQTEEIRLVARMRYAAGLSPDAFAGYLAGGGAQPWALARLPALDDPMLQRVERIRSEEYRFIDNVDEQYGQLHDEMEETYNLWRQYRREQASYEAEYLERVETRDDHDRHGSFSAMQRDYNTYRAYRTRQQDLRELAGGFNNEVGPTVVETRGRVFRLSGSLDSRYREWRDILREIFVLETGLPPAGDADRRSSAPSE